MRGAQLAINILLFILVGLLFYFQFSNRSEMKEEVKESVISKSSAEQSVGNALEIRYVNTDSVWAKYAYVKELNALLSKKQKQFESDLDRKLNEFQNDVEKFREKAATMSMEEGQKKQEELMQKEQNLQKLQEEYSHRLIEEEDKMKKELRTKISSFLAGFKANDVELIIDNSSGSSVLFYADSLDITSEVIEGLNSSMKE